MATKPKTIQAQRPEDWDAGSARWNRETAWKRGIGSTHLDTVANPLRELYTFGFTMFFITRIIRLERGMGFIRLSMILWHRSETPVSFDSTVNTKQWFPLGSKWCRISCIHSIKRILKEYQQKEPRGGKTGEIRKTTHPNRALAQAKPELWPKDSQAPAKQGFASWIYAPHSFSSSPTSVSVI